VPDSRAIIFGGAVAKRENEYQPALIERIKQRFPGCFVLKNDEQYLQGIPDLMILWGHRWAALEVKRDLKAMRNPQPNQPYYVELLDGMSFAAFIYPGNEEDVLDALQRSFSVCR
jgi:hypothetical protein